MALADQISHFKSTSWCAELIEDPEFSSVRTFARIPKPTAEDSFIAETLATDRTIRACLTLERKPETEESPVTEIRVLYDVGDGVNGYPKLSHGGFIATLLDELMGNLLTVNHERMKALMENVFTIYLNVRYLKPLPTPSLILGTARFTKVEPRKYFIKATLEDGKGTMYATGDGLFGSPKSKI